MSAANTFQSLQPDLKESYSDSKKKKRFSKIQKMYSGGKAMSELNASKNPMKSLKDKSYLNIKKLKGVAV